MPHRLHLGRFRPGPLRLDAWIPARGARPAPPTSRITTGGRGCRPGRCRISLARRARAPGLKLCDKLGPCAARKGHGPQASSSVINSALARRARATGLALCDKLGRQYHASTQRGPIASLGAAYPRSGPSRGHPTQWPGTSFSSATPWPRPGSLARLATGTPSPPDNPRPRLTPSRHGPGPGSLPRHGQRLPGAPPPAPPRVRRGSDAAPMGGRVDGGGLTFEPPTLRAPPEHPHRFPESRAWRPVSVDWLNFLNGRSTRPPGAPPPVAILDLRSAFTALFPTNTAQDLPPSQPGMRALLRLSAAQSCLAGVSYRPAIPLARRFFVPPSGVEVSRDGLYELLRISRRLQDLLPQSAAHLFGGATDLFVDSTRAATADFLFGLPRDPWPGPARLVARANLQCLFSQLDAIRPTGPLPSETDVLQDLSYHHRTLDAIEACHQWLWLVLGSPTTSKTTPDRTCISGETPWQPWLSQWLTLRDRLA